MDIFIVTDFMPGGDLATLLDNQDVEITEKLVRFYTAEVVLALEVVHDLGYAHRDIKPENCLLDSRGLSTLIPQ